MPEPWLVEACSHLKSKRLFYPSAGSDVEKPISTFLAWVNEFWFVDSNYRIDSPLLENKDYRILSTSCFELSGHTIRHNESFIIPVSSQCYIHLPSGREFTANACCGKGYDTFRAAFRIPGKSIAVFFYRGDSPGEGGSGFYWLESKIAKFVVDQLDSHGVLVSDGSNAMPKLSRFLENNEVGSAAVGMCEPFEFHGRYFRCVGYLGERYGPTLVWSLAPQSS